MTPAEFIQRFNIAGKTVLETGCLEGKQTVELLQAGVDVFAIDCKQANLDATAKAIAKMEVGEGIIRNTYTILADLETYTFPDGEVDACWHSGVLYHLTKPVEHLHRNLPKIKTALYLSTHYSVDGKRHWHRETQGMPKAGLSNKSLWLTDNDIFSIIAEHFGDKFECLDARLERHGWRLELVAWR